MKMLRRLRCLLPPSVSRTGKAKDRSGVPPETLRQFPFIQERLDRWVIGKRFCEDISNNVDFAESLGADPKDVTWFFRTVVREDQRTWRVRLRIEEAVSLLKKDPDMPLGTIAEAVGFSDASNFARQFRKWTGVAPHQWRERHGG